MAPNLAWGPHEHLFDEMDFCFEFQVHYLVVHFTVPTMCYVPVFVEVVPVFVAVLPALCAWENPHCFVPHAVKRT